MEKLDLSKLKLASSSLGERIKTSGAQMGRTISSKMKEILQSPTPESKAVDEATADTLSDPNWGLNLRICALISRGEYSGAEVVRAIKRKLVAARSPAVQGLGLDLLETCTSNCEKVFSEVASEKVLDDMVRLIDDPRTDHGVRVRAMQLIRGWGESDDLDYLPVFRQTYMNLKSKEFPPSAPEEGFPSAERNLESYLGQHQLSSSERNPIPDADAANEVPSFISYGFQSNEEKKEHLLVARNTLDIISSILNSGTEPEPGKDDLLTSMLEKCKQSLSVVQRIIESTSDDEVMLFDALNLHEELQNAISRHSEPVAAAHESGEAKEENNTGQLSGESNTNKSIVGAHDTNVTTDKSKAGSSETNNSSREEESTAERSSKEESTAEKSSKE